jgi:hypothetical protein
VDAGVPLGSPSLLALEGMAADRPVGTAAGSTGHDRAAAQLQHHQPSASIHRSEKAARYDQQDEADPASCASPYLVVRYAPPTCRGAGPGAGEEAARDSQQQQGAPSETSGSAADPPSWGSGLTLTPGLEFSLVDGQTGRTLVSNGQCKRAGVAEGAGRGVMGKAALPRLPFLVAVPLPELPPELHRCVRFMDAGRGQHMHPLLHMVCGWGVAAHAASKMLTPAHFFIASWQICHVE